MEDFWKNGVANMDSTAADAASDGQTVMDTTTQMGKMVKDFVFEGMYLFAFKHFF